MEHNKQVINLPIHVPWAFSFLQHLSASCPLLDTSKVMYAQKHLFGFLGMLLKTVLCHKTPSVILWDSILQNESYSLLMGHKAYVCRLPEMGQSFIQHIPVLRRYQIHFQIYSLKDKVLHHTDKVHW